MILSYHQQPQLPDLSFTRNMIKIVENFLELNPFAPQLLMMVVELTLGDVEVVGCDLHQGLSVDCDWHTHDEIFDFLTLFLDFVSVHVLTTN